MPMPAGPPLSRSTSRRWCPPVTAIRRSGNGRSQAITPTGKKKFSIEQYKERLEKHVKCFSSGITDRQRMNLDPMPSTSGAWFDDKTARLLAIEKGCTSYIVTWDSFDVTAYLASGRSNSVRLSDVRLAENDMIFVLKMDELHYYGLNRGGRVKAMKKGAVGE